MNIRVLVVFTAACGGSAASGSDAPMPSSPATFQGASAVQLSAALDAASGIDAIDRPFTLALALAAQSNPPACPVITGAGSTWTISGGCTEGNGTMWSGQATIANGPGFGAASPTYDTSKPTVVTFMGFGAMGDVDAAIALDGHVDYTHMGVISSSDLDFGYSAAASDLTVTVAGVVATNRLQVTRADGMLSAGAGSTIDVGSLGSATVVGSWASGDGAPAGTITLHGVDDVVFDVAQRTNADCVPYAIGATTGTACPL